MSTAHLWISNLFFGFIHSFFFLSEQSKEDCQCPKGLYHEPMDPTCSRIEVPQVPEHPEVTFRRLDSASVELLFPKALDASNTTTYESIVDSGDGWPLSVEELDEDLLLSNVKIFPSTRDMRSLVIRAQNHALIPHQVDYPELRLLMHPTWSCKLPFCWQCGPGQFLTGDKNEVGEGCQPCPAGTYQAHFHNATQCQKCPPGTYFGSTGATTGLECRLCPAEQMSRERGQDRCEAPCPGCPEGSSLNITSAIWEQAFKESQAESAKPILAVQPSGDKLSAVLTCIALTATVCVVIGVLAVCLKPVRSFVSRMDFLFNRRLGLHEMVDSETGRLRFKRSPRRGFLTLCAMLSMIAAAAYLLFDFSVSQKQELRSLIPYEDEIFDLGTDHCHSDGKTGVELAATIRFVDVPFDCDDLLPLNGTDGESGHVQASLDWVLNPGPRELYCGDGARKECRRAQRNHELTGSAWEGMHDGFVGNMPFQEICERDGVNCVDLLWRAQRSSTASNRNIFRAHLTSEKDQILYARYIAIRLSVKSWKDGRRGTLTHVMPFLDYGSTQLTGVIVRAVHKDEMDEDVRMGYNIGLSTTYKTNRGTPGDMWVVRRLVSVS